MNRGIKLLLPAIIAVLLLPVAALIAATPTACTVCILELQTSGIHGEEDQDFVIVTNRGSTNVTSLQLKYYNVAGVLSDSMTLSIGTLNAGSTKAYVSVGLAGANPGVDSLKSMALSSSGGSVQLAKTASGATTVFDTVGWGGQTNVREASAAPFQASGTTLSRKSTGAIAQDTNNNADDFEVRQQSCNGIDFSEIQPFATDIDGAQMTTWIELIGLEGQRGDCQLVTSGGEEYTLSAAALPTLSERVILDGSTDASGAMQGFHLGDGAGSLTIGGQSLYAAAKPVRLPLATVTYAAMSRGQTWASIDGIWRRTYDPTPGESNRYLLDKTVIDSDPSACESVKMTEILPNPAGEDTDKEWIELHNDSNDLVSLARCQIAVGSEVYGFLEDDMMAPGEWRAESVFFDGSTAPKLLSLKNTEQNVVILQRTVMDASSVIIQSFSYQEAPEGQTWARFADGWRWVGPTPNHDNLSDAAEVDSPLTDQPATTDTDQSLPPGGTPSAQVNITISELLPNPAAPQTDDADEFVELYNPGDTPVDLSGYKIQAGDTYSYSYTLESVQLQPKHYYSVTSRQSSLSLANGSGRVRVVAPDGTVVAESDPYQSAPAGQAWANIDSVWQWTGQPTIGVANLMLSPSVLAADKAAKKATTKAAAKKPAAVKAAKASAKKSTAKDKAPAKIANASKSDFADAPRLHLAVLAGVGLLAVLYAAYEYRQDIANRYRQLRRFRTARAIVGGATAWRRGA